MIVAYTCQNIGGALFLGQEYILNMKLRDINIC